MPKVVGVRFRGIGKSYHFAPGNLKLAIGDIVLVHTSQGDSLGIVSDRVREIEASQLNFELKPVLRVATAEDEAIYEENGQREKEAYKICRQKIREHDLDMNLVDVEYVFDRSRMIFYFTSEGRVDFRNLVRDLAQIFRIRIELRQIGVRDEARMVGGLGICGRPLCCSSFLNEFIPVSIKMAKEQGLSMNPGKLSGCCGRLMCCLKYEQAAYESIRKQMPKLGVVLSLNKGKYKVESIDYLREKITCVSLENSEENCVLGVEEYQEFVQSKKAQGRDEEMSSDAFEALDDSTSSDLKTAFEASEDEADDLSEEETALLEEIESQSGKTKIFFGNEPERAIDLLRLKPTFDTEHQGCCCQHQSHGDSNQACQGGCCSQKQEIDEKLTKATLHGRNLDELAQKGEVEILPSWIDAEVLADDEEMEDEYHEVAYDETLYNHKDKGNHRSRTRSKSQSHSHFHSKKRQPRTNQVEGKKKGQGLASSPKTKPTNDTERALAQRRTQTNKRGPRSGEVRQRSERSAGFKESKPYLTKVQNKGNKSAEKSQKRNADRRKNGFHFNEN